MDDLVNAFMDHPAVDVPSAKIGPLAGYSLAVKDIFDVAGYKTGCGSPEKLAEAEIATETAPSVQKFLDAGARFIGKTTTEELAFSLNGDNIHYPRPLNVAAPGRLTGGSSSGSAAAVAAGLADIATGSDTGGSVRAPASYCGLMGLRATHGRMSLEGTMPLAESFDCFGWFAKTPDLYANVAGVLLGDDEKPFKPGRIMIADDLFDLLMGEGEATALAPAVSHVSDLAPVSHLTIADGDLETWYWAFRKLQAAEAWEAHGDWIERVQAKLGPGVKERFDFGRSVTRADVDEMSPIRAQITRHVEELLGDDGLIVLPTVPSIAPKADMEFENLDEFRNRALRLLCTSGLTGLPQLTLPFVRYQECPLGLSLLAPRGMDRSLIDIGVRLLKSFSL
ncbi:MAG: amidase [Pseudomonadota bacterium]